MWRLNVMSKLRVLALIDILKKLPEPRAYGQLLAVRLLEDSPVNVNLEPSQPTATAPLSKELWFQVEEHHGELVWAICL